MAAGNGVHFVFGFHELGPGRRAYNTLVHLDAAGEICAMYRKIHLFDADLADGTRLLESKNTAAGDTPVVTELPFGTLGLSICYDLRFPAAVSAAGRSRRRRACGAGRLHQRHRTRSLARIAAGAGDRVPGLRRCFGPARRARPRESPFLWSCVDRRSLG